MTNNTVFPVKLRETSKFDSVDFNNLSFGSIFTDHMFICHYDKGSWNNPEIVPYAPITLEPSARVFSLWPSYL